MTSKKESIFYLENQKLPDGKFVIVVGGFGCGKTTAIIDKFMSCSGNKMFFDFTTDDFDKSGIDRHEYSELYNIAEKSIEYIFIDNVEIAISYYGRSWWEKVEKCAKNICCTTTPADFYDYVEKSDDDNTRWVEFDKGAILSLCNLKDAKIIEMKMKDNHYLPTGYIEALSNVINYNED